MSDNYNIEYLRHTPKDEKYICYDVLNNTVWISTNNYIIAKKALSLFGEPFKVSTDLGDNVLELCWKVPIEERKKLTKIGLNTYALGRKKSKKQ